MKRDNSAIARKGWQTRRHADPGPVTDKIPARLMTVELAAGHTENSLNNHKAQYADDKAAADIRMTAFNGRLSNIEQELTRLSQRVYAKLWWQFW